MELPVTLSEIERARRLALAREAFQEFSAQCFWWYPRDFVVTEKAIPGIIQGLRENGGHAGYRKVGEICR